MDEDCNNCKYDGLNWDEEPCDSCTVGDSNFEAKENAEIKEKKFYGRIGLNVDEPCALFCNPSDANDFLEMDNDFQNVLVISSMFPVGECIFTSRQEFSDWLFKDLGDVVAVNDETENEKQNVAVTGEDND